MGSEIAYIVVPVVVMVIILKVCLICWRVWAYQQRRQRVEIAQRRRTTQRTHAPAVARVVRVERCITEDGAFAQRTSYAINQPGQPTRQLQRTIIVRPADNRRPNDPNLPPSYDTAVTGKDKSVTVEQGPGTQVPPTSGATPTVPPTTQPPTTANPNLFRSFLPQPSEPPAYSPRSPAVLPTTQEEDDDIPLDDRSQLLS